MDYEKEIVELRGRVSTVEADVKNLVGWQRTQNGTINRMYDEIGKVNTNVNGIYKIMLGTATTAALSFLGTVITLLVILSSRGGN